MKLASINLRKLVLSPTGSINLGFILREDLLLCSSMHDVIQLCKINLEMSCLYASEDAEARRFNHPCWHIRGLAKFKEISKCCQNLSNFSWIAAKLIHKFWSWKLKFRMFIYFLWCSENQIPWFVGLPKWKLSRHNSRLLACIFLGHAPQRISDLLTLSKNMYALLTLSPLSCLIVLSNIHAPSSLCHVEEQEALDTSVNFQTLSLS
jgi:hypothetical protein